MPVAGLAAFALHAVKFQPEPRAPAGLGHYPGPLGPRRLVAHMLVMAAGKLGHPVVFLILVIANDWQVHSGWFLLGV